MTVHKAVRTLQSDLQRLRNARQERRSDVKDLKQDRRELAKDRWELKSDLRQGQQLHRALDDNRRELQSDLNAKQRALSTIQTQRQEILAQYGADGFDSIAPGATPNPLLTAALQGLEQQESEVTAKFDAEIAGDRADIQRDRAGILGKRAEIRNDRKEIKHDFQVVRHDHKELAHDRKAISNARTRALKHLRPAEYQMGLKNTNRARRELGLAEVDHVIRPAGPGNVTSAMLRLAKAAPAAAMTLGGYTSQGLCATGVSRAIQNAFGITVYGNGNQIDNNLPRSKFRQVKMSLAQALKVPGLVLTWERTSTALGSRYGHTAITTGDGHTSASDFIESNTLAGSSGRSGLKIFVPIG